MINKELLDILVCPVCKGPVNLEGKTITCKVCSKAYPIKNDIPIMIIKEANKHENK